MGVSVNSIPRGFSQAKRDVLTSSIRPDPDYFGKIIQNAVFEIDNRADRDDT